MKRIKKLDEDLRVALLDKKNQLDTSHVSQAVETDAEDIKAGVKLCLVYCNGRAEEV